MRQVPFSDFLNGVDGSISSVKAASALSSGMAYVLAGSRLREFTARFSQSFGASPASADTVKNAAAKGIIVFISFLLVFSPWLLVPGY